MKSAQLQTLRNTLTIFRATGISLWWFVPAILLSIVAAGFEGAQMGLFIPFIQGFLTRDYSFIKEVPYLGTLIDSLPAWISSRDRTLLAFLLSLLVVAVVVKNTFKYGSFLSMSFLSTRMLHHLRKKLFVRYLSFGKLYFDSTNVGHHSVVLSEFARSALKPILVADRFISSFFSLMSCFVVMMFISWKLTLIAMPLFAVLHFSIQKLIGIIRRISHALAHKASELSKRAIEVLTTLPLVKASNMEQKEYEKFRDVSDHRSVLEFRMDAAQKFIPPLQEVLTMVSLLLLILVVLYLIVTEGRTNSSAFLVYLYLVQSAASKFGFLTNYRTYLADASGPIEEVIEILSEDGKYYVPSGDQEFAGLQKSIAIQNLTFTFPGGKKALNALSFEIKKGSMVAIVAPTGAGKTTIINLLLRFYDAPAGSLFIDGKDIRSFSTESLHTHMALVSQETLLLNESLRSNITYGVESVSAAALADAIRKSRLNAFIEGLPEGLDTVIGDRGVKLSGGEKQRVAIARALLKNADILILDEATSSLDSTTEALIQEAIDEATEGRTTLVIAHRLSTIRHAKNIVVVSAGTCVEQGSLEELLTKKGEFYTLWERQKFV